MEQQNNIFLCLIVVFCAASAAVLLLDRIHCLLAHASKTILYKYQRNEDDKRVEREKNVRNYIIFNEIQ